MWLLRDDLMFVNTHDGPEIRSPRDQTDVTIILRDRLLGSVMKKRSGETVRGIV